MFWGEREWERMRSVVEVLIIPYLYCDINERINCLRSYEITIEHVGEQIPQLNQQIERGTIMHLK